MNRVFFRDIQGNVFDVSKVIGLFAAPLEGEGELHYFTFVENIGQIEVKKSMFNELMNSLIIFDSTETSEG